MQALPSTENNTAPITSKAPTTCSMTAKIALTLLAICAVSFTCVGLCHAYHLKVVPILYSSLGVVSALSIIAMMVLGCRRPKPGT